MKLGTSRRGSMAPALVAFLVLAGSAALAATQGPSPTVSPRVPAVSHVQPGRLGYLGDATAEEPGGLDGQTSTDADVAGCGDAMVEGDTALERAHGLDRAIQAILQRCGRGPVTEGLLNALERLRENKAKHAEHGNQGKSGQEHGKPSGDPGKSGEDHGQSGQDHGNDAEPQDQGGGAPAPPQGGGNDLRDGGAPQDQGPGSR